MNKLITRQTLMCASLLMLLTHFAKAQTGYFGPYFIDTATAANTHTIYFDQTTLNSPLLNNDSNAIILFTPNWTAGSNVYNDAATGVYYYPQVGQWSIYNENQTSFPVGFGANVLVPDSHGSSFVSAATGPMYNYSDITNASTDGNPGALVFVTHNWGTGYGVGGGIYDTVPVGVWYNTITSKWSIFNEKLNNAMSPGIAFNVFVADTTGGAAFIQTSSASNVLSGSTDNTKIDNPLTNGNPGAVLIVTQNYSAPAGYSYDSVPIGVYYDILTDKWCIFHQDHSAMQLGVSFNVLVASQSVTAGIANVPANDMQFKVYPNPASDNVTVHYMLKQNTDVSVKLYATDGRELSTICGSIGTAGNNTLQYDVSELQPGSYFMVLITDESRATYPMVVVR